MAYIQISTKCNMTCDHCAYSCNSHGKHMTWSTFLDAVRFDVNHGTEYVSIGGGEPTLNPNFFDFLRHALDCYAGVWLATNGSRTKSMRRLIDILDGEDEEIYQDNKLCVALSLDMWHRTIDSKISGHWISRENMRCGYEVRRADTFSDGLSHMGRAKRNELSTDRNKKCICDEIFIKVDGSIKLCGCANAPIIGHVSSGYSEKGERMIEDPGYQECMCCKGLGKKPKFISDIEERRYVEDNLCVVQEGNA